MAEKSLVDQVVSLCSRRGVLFPTGEIYGGLAGFFDYGPVGVELKKNLENAWWKHFVTLREDVVGIDGSIVTNPKVWKASGHLDSFTDPLVDCTKCKLRFRADHLVEDELKLSVDGIGTKQLDEMIVSHKVVCPKCKGELGNVRVFNLMFSTRVGVLENEENKVYLRPETAQSIFINFKAVQGTSRKQLPFGIAQVGKAFRNEIAPRNFVFRAREFDLAEIEYFVHPEKLNVCPLLSMEHLEFTALFYTSEMQAGKKKHEELKVSDLLDSGVIGAKWHAYWLVESYNWLTEVVGLKKENLRFRQHVKDELSHYSSETWDIEYNYPWGWKELQGVANRTNYDLSQHTRESGKELVVFDEATKTKVIPYVIEPSIGIGRLLFTVLLDAFYEKQEKKEEQETANEKGTEKGNGKGKDEVKNVLRLKPAISPVKFAVFPLMKKDGLAEKAREVCAMLKSLGVAVEYDESGSIGKRYARHDEIGTPWCITIDYDSLKDNDVTLRERDSGKQKRLKIAKLVNECSALLQS